MDDILIKQMSKQKFMQIQNDLFSFIQKDREELERTKIRKLDLDIKIAGLAILWLQLDHYLETSLFLETRKILSSNFEINEKLLWRSKNRKGYKIKEQTTEKKCKIRSISPPNYEF